MIPPHVLDFQESSGTMCNGPIDWVVLCFKRRKKISFVPWKTSKKDKTFEIAICKNNTVQTRNSKTKWTLIHSIPMNPDRVKGTCSHLNYQHCCWVFFREGFLDLSQLCQMSLFTFIASFSSFIVLRTVTTWHLLVSLVWVCINACSLTEQCRSWGQRTVMIPISTVSSAPGIKHDT